MNIEKETSEYQRIVATVVGDLSEAELKFYLCVTEGGKGCNIGEPNDDLFPENDSEFVRIQKNYGHPWHSDIKQFDFYSVSSLKQQSDDRHIAPLGFRANQSLLLLLNVVCLAHSQQIPIVFQDVP
jgi:hypothetical protein